jgi:ATP-dependent Clp protease ATP-binding subunit ClpB
MLSTEHLLLGIADIGEGPAFTILRNYGVSRDQIFSVIKRFAATQRSPDQAPEDKYQALQRYCRDLTEEARKGKLDPVIEGTKRYAVSCRSSRENEEQPRLIANRASCKTAIVEASHSDCKRDIRKH